MSAAETMAAQDALPDDEAAVRAAHAGARPLAPHGRADAELLRRKPRPLAKPLREQTGARAASADGAPATNTLQDRLETRDDPHYLRTGVPRQSLRDLRRGRWPVDAELDLHGATRDEARQALTAFLENCRTEGVRCARLIHGRGWRSQDGVPVLKTLSRNWLAQHPEVLAYCEAPLAQGGEGAVLVLLRA